MSLRDLVPVTDCAKDRAFHEFLRTPSARCMYWTSKLTPGGEHREVKACRKLRDEAGEVTKVEEVKFKVHACFKGKDKEIALRAREHFKGEKRPRILRCIRAEILDAEEELFAGGIEPAPKSSRVRELFK